MKTPYLCIVIAAFGLTIASAAYAQVSTKYQQDFGCAPGMFGCDEDFVMGGACSANHNRVQCTVTKTGGDGNCFAGHRHPKLDTTNIWETSDPHDCRCRVHAGAAGPSFGQVACSVQITEDGGPPAVPYFQTPAANVACCSVIAATGNYGCNSSQRVYQAKLLGLAPGTDGVALCNSGKIKGVINGKAISPARCNKVGPYTFGIFDVDDTSCH